jgi:regulator of protease activity HflC (stomatin/prohibitin superfamily)
MLFGVFLLIAVAGAIFGEGRYPDGLIGTWVSVWIIVGNYFLFALKVASQWQKVVVLRLGKFHGLKGPGLFWVIPIIDTAVMWIDHRVAVTSFSAEKTHKRYCTG